MRADMAKVVVERPRRGHSALYYERPRGTIEQLEGLPASIGMKNRRYNGDSKSFSDLLGPLRRFLGSRVGQRWDDVYSEICERIRPSSTTQLHILDHVRSIVTTNAMCSADGRIVAVPRWGRFIGEVSGYYVHPETGVLCYRERPSRRRERLARQRTKPVMFVGLGGERELHKVDGIWYWAVFADRPPPYLVHHKIATFADGVETAAVVTRLVEPRPAAALDHGPDLPGRYRAGKRQASSADLRRYGLQNDIID